MAALKEDEPLLSRVGSIKAIDVRDRSAQNRRRVADVGAGRGAASDYQATGVTTSVSPAAT